MTSVLLDKQNSVAIVTLNRPDVHNAFDEEMIASLTSTFTELSSDTSLRAVVLKASGKSFCAGGDLNWMKRAADFTEAENKADALKLAGMVDAIYACPHLTIALVKGAVFGGGVGVVSACDVVIADKDSSKFSLSEVKLGLIPAAIAPYVLRAIGARNMGRYAVTAERFCAKKAGKMGLVHDKVHGETELESALTDLLKSISSNAPEAMREAKKLQRELEAMTIGDATLKHTAGAIAARRASDEGKEGISAFLEKRSPNWVSTDA
jgi:methylglutaconyl-CoA hydratase